MAYLGAIGTAGQLGFTADWYFIAWVRYTIAYVALGEIIGQYAAHGGYVYVK